MSGNIRFRATARGKLACHPQIWTQEHNMSTTKYADAGMPASMQRLLGLRVDYCKGQVRDLLSELEYLGRMEELRVDRGIDLREQVRQFEIALIKSTLKLTHGHQRRAASLLQINPTTLNAKIKLYGIAVENDSTAVKKTRGTQ